MAIIHALLARTRQARERGPVSVGGGFVSVWSGVGKTSLSATQALLTSGQGSPPPLAFVLVLAACAVLAGAKSLTAIEEWAADALAAVLTVRGGPSREPSGPTAPAEATVRRVPQRVDGNALDTAISSWLATRDPDQAGDLRGDPASSPRPRTLAQVPETGSRADPDPASARRRSRCNITASRQRAGPRR
ncbi:transposase family protein [Streptomyces sp. NPDC050625]|uniref:transposase family protein n=1 Tax=Streptomyces sp. NPDC050625 TaxID=3154629 RepID=UPI003439853E